MNDKKERCVVYYHNTLILNGSNPDIEVIFFEYEQFNTKGERIYHNTWITDILIDGPNCSKIGQKL